MGGRRNYFLKWS